jgi:hypothetical protein
MRPAMNPSPPTLYLDIPLKELPGNYGGWRETADYFCWSGRFAAGDPPLGLWEKVDGGVIRVPDKPVMLHIVPAGRAHHIDHLFGYWHLCEADKFFVRKVHGDEVFYALVVGGMKNAYRRDTIAWLCPSCGTELESHTLETGGRRWPKFLEEQLQLVRQFNEQEERRRCRHCGTLHPKAYGLQPENDTPGEAEMRRAW